MSSIITISECLKRLENGETALIEVWLYDRNRKKGGSIATFSCKLLQRTASDKSPIPYNNNGSEQLEKQRKRSPNHSIFYTRNVRIMVDGYPSAVIEKIHPPLIKSFNGIKTVP